MNKIKFLTLLLLILSWFIFFFNNWNNLTVYNWEWKTHRKSDISVLTPQVHQRWPDQTYLTFPEWFLAHGPQEQADYFAHMTSTNFPYMNHVSQLWGSYGAVYDKIKDEYAFNTWYHVMIMVIWVSSTVEFSLKALYETVIGRLTDPPLFDDMIEEDVFYAKFSKDYVDFINHTPWYEFDFQSRLFALWTDTSFFGDRFFRKLERKYLITWELFIKTIYWKLIEIGTKSAYESPLLETAVIIDFLPKGIKSELPKLQVLEQYDDGSTLVLLPRYWEFTIYASTLAEKWVAFREIAWNNWAVLISILEESDYSIPKNAEVLFTQPITTKKWITRKAILTYVSHLSELLTDLKQNSVIIEHIYDY